MTSMALILVADNVLIVHAGVSYDAFTRFPPAAGDWRESL